MMSSCARPIEIVAASSSNKIGHGKTARALKHSDPKDPSIKGLRVYGLGFQVKKYKNRRI